MGFNNDDNFDADKELGPEYREEVIAASAEERKFAAELIVFLQYDLGVDVSRLRVNIREKTVYIQGTVSSREEKDEIEKSILSRPGVSKVDSNIFIHNNE